MGAHLRPGSHERLVQLDGADLLRADRDKEHRAELRRVDAHRTARVHAEHVDVAPQGDGVYAIVLAVDLLPPAHGTAHGTVVAVVVYANAGDEARLWDAGIAAEPGADLGD